VDQQELRPGSWERPVGFRPIGLGVLAVMTQDRLLGVGQSHPLRLLPASGDCVSLRPLMSGVRQCQREKRLKRASVVVVAIDQCDKVGKRNGQGVAFPWGWSFDVPKIRADCIQYTIFRIVYNLVKRVDADGMKNSFIGTYINTCVPPRPLIALPPDFRRGIYCGGHRQ